MQHKYPYLSGAILSWVCVAAGIFGLLCIWRLPYAAELRPVVQFGMPWLDLVKAWLPEGILLGIAAFLLHRICHRTPLDRPSLVALLVYLALWLIIWCFAAFAPGLMLFTVLSDALKPAKDIFLIAGLAGAIVAGGMALVYGGLFLAASFTTMMLAAVIAGFAHPAMIGLSFHGLSGLREKRPLLDFGKCLLIIILIGTAYWAWRGFCFFAIDDAKYAIIADVVGTMLLMGTCAHLLERLRARQAGMLT